MCVRELCWVTKEYNNKEKTSSKFIDELTRRLGYPSVRESVAKKWRRTGDTLGSRWWWTLIELHIAVCSMWPDSRDLWLVGFPVNGRAKSFALPVWKSVCVVRCDEDGWPKKRSFEPDCLRNLIGLSYDHLKKAFQFARISLACMLYQHCISRIHFWEISRVNWNAFLSYWNKGFLRQICFAESIFNGIFPNMAIVRSCTFRRMLIIAVRENYVYSIHIST